MDNLTVHNTQENPSRVFICQECSGVFADEEARRDAAKGEWGHICKAKKYRTEQRCESFLEPYLPEVKP